MNRQVNRKELLLKSYINVSDTERKIFSEISPRKNINATISILILILIVSVLSLFSARQLLHIQDHVLYALLLIVFLVVGWRISLLKVIMLQTSKNKLFVKYVHPLYSKNEPPVLEIPFCKLESFAIIREFFVCYLVVNRRSTKGNDTKSFYFRLGFLSKKQVENISKTINNIDKVAVDINV